MEESVKESRTDFFKVTTINEIKQWVDSLNLRDEENIIMTTVDHTQC